MAPKQYRIGRTNLTGAERLYLLSATRQGLTRNQTREGFRALFGRGFRNTTFTQLRRHFEEGQLRAARANRVLAGGGTAVVVTPDVASAVRGQVYQIQGYLTIADPTTGTQQKYFNFFTSSPTSTGWEDRIEEIVQNAGVHEGSAWNVEGITFQDILTVDKRS